MGEIDRLEVDLGLKSKGIKCEPISYGSIAVEKSRFESPLVSEDHLLE